jgi:uncharacterized protein with PQ loop repeat
MINIIGYLATVITLFSFCLKDMTKLRIVSSIACLTWIIYGLMRQDTPVIFVNSSIIIIHLFYLLKRKYEPLK